MKKMFITMGVFACLLSVGGATIWAQPKPEAKPEAKKAAAPLSPASKEAEFVWKRAKQWTLQYIDAMPEEALNYKPVPEVRSFAEQMLHLAFWNYGLTDALADKPSPYGKKQEDLEKRDDLKKKAALRKIVEESYDFVLALLPKYDETQWAERVTFFTSNVPRRLILTVALDHQTHHRGQTTMYLRLKGITPPPEP
ncbi:MAG: DinB family protein [Blastocatellia bacterium]